MRFTRFAAALLLSFTAFVPTVLSQTSGKNAITYPNQMSVVDTSDPFTITWKPDTKGTVTIVLLKGPQKNLNELGAIAAKIKNTGSFTWNVPSSLEDKSTMGKDEIYGFKIIDDSTGDFEYSPPFQMIVPDSTYTDPADEEDKETTTTSATSTKTSTASTSTSSSTKTTSTTSTTEKTTSTTSTTSSTTSKPTTTKTSTSTTSTSTQTTPTPEPTEDSSAQQAEATPTESSKPTKSAEAKKEEKKNPLGIPIIAWVGIGIGGLFAMLILSYCVSLGVRNQRLRREERERSLMPSDIKPTQAAGPYTQLSDDIEKAPETPGTVPYGPTAFASQRDTVTSSNYSNNAGYGPGQRGNNIEMAEYSSQGGNGGYHQEPDYNQSYSNPPYGGQHSFREPPQPFRGGHGQQGGYPAQQNGSFPVDYNNYPSQQQHYNDNNYGGGSGALPGRGGPAYGY